MLNRLSHTVTLSFSPHSFSIFPSNFLPFILFLIRISGLLSQSFSHPFSISIFFLSLLPFFTVFFLSLYNCFYPKYQNFPHSLKCSISLCLFSYRDGFNYSFKYLFSHLVTNPFSVCCNTEKLFYYIVSVALVISLIFVNLVPLKVRTKHEPLLNKPASVLLSVQLIVSSQ